MPPRAVREGSARRYLTGFNPDLIADCACCAKNSLLFIFQAETGKAQAALLFVAKSAH
jgi:hypothetical protein